MTAMNDPDTSPASAGSAAETVQQALRQRIIEGELLPGTRLIDANVAERHGVSRNTARDALRLLAADGLAVSVRNAGYSVRELTVEDIRDLYTARRIVETGAVLQSVAASSHLFDVVEGAIVNAESCVETGDWSRVGTWSLSFHRALVGLAMSPSLDHFFVSTVAQLRLAFAVIPDEGAFQVQWIPRDRAIAELVLSGARAEAAVELAGYLDDSEARVIDAIRAAQRLRRRAEDATPQDADPIEAPSAGRTASTERNETEQ